MPDCCEDAKICIICFLLLAGKSRRVQFLECPNDINGMIDAAKIADLALLLIDGSYGFEMVCCQTFIFTFTTSSICSSDCSVKFSVQHLVELNLRVFSLNVPHKLVHILLAHMFGSFYVWFFFHNHVQQWTQC